MPSPGRHNLGAEIEHDRCDEITEPFASERVKDRARIVVPEQQRDHRYPKGPANSERAVWILARRSGLYGIALGGARSRRVIHSWPPAVASMGSNGGIGAGNSSIASLRRLRDS